MKKRGAIRRGLDRVRRYFWGHKYIYQQAWALLVGFPPFFVTNFQSVERFAAEVRADWPRLGAILDASALRWLIFAALWVALLTLAKNVLSGWLKREPDGWEQAPQILLSALDTIVGHKEQRFAKRLQQATHKSAQGKPLTPAEVFRSITQPTAQFCRIGEAIWWTFDLLTRTSQERKDLRVQLGVVHQDKLKKFLCSYPSHLPVKSSLEELSHPSSSIMSAARSGRLVIVESTADEVSKADPQFRATRSLGPEDEGSLLCYPVEMPTKGVVIVISIFYPEDNTFVERYRAKYDGVLSKFDLRVRLEYALHGLKLLADSEYRDVENA
ncbi:hypothetical protein O4G98_08440 [Zoogloeaceae bacterium G21618-S1]|nr:hypothetical protein [Zoogloeaceae bacterium G21618-S1]